MSVAALHPEAAAHRVRGSVSSGCAIRAACRSSAPAWSRGGSASRAVAGDGVVGGAGTVGGRPVACYAQDGGFLGGSLGERQADTIVRVLRTAERGRIPVVGFVESGGARIGEGTAALAGYGQIFAATVRLSGVVPQISVVSGASAGGGAYSPALTDLVLMTEDAAMFLTGPGVVREALGEDIDAAGLGGPRVHERNGVCALVEPDVGAAAQRVRELLGYLPASAGDVAPDRRRLAAAGGGRSRRRWCRPSRAAPTTCAGCSRRSATPTRCSSSTRVGRATWSWRSAGSRAGRWRSWPTSRATSAGCSTPPPPRRRRGSSRWADCVRAAGGGDRRHPGLHARLAPGAGRCHPSRRVARAGVRRGSGAEADGDAAQGLWWRLHHDELPRPRIRSGARLAAGRAGDHERPRRGGDRRAAAAAGGRRTRTPSVSGWPPSTPPSTSGPMPRPPAGSSTRSSRRPRPARGWPARCGPSAARG